jgi:cytochrome c oxidase assembly protein subunit 15
MGRRALGIVFAVPCSYFAARGYITRPLAARLAVLFSLGGAQGFVGWWMVKSGLEVRRRPLPPPPPHLHATRAEGTCCFLGLSPTPTLHRAIRLAKASDHRVSAAVPGGQEPKNNQVARVSPYRLAAHLTSAFVIYTGLLWTSLSVLYPMAPPLPSAVAAMRRARALLLPVGCPPSLSPSLRLPLSLGCVSVAR